MTPIRRIQTDFFLFIRAYQSNPCHLYSIFSLSFHFKFSEQHLDFYSKHNHAVWG